jgi:LmbE family N-acetylglucosaminyl deacetylase
MSAILIQPHDDDAVLFACWTILRHKPLVVTVFDSYVQPGRGIPGTSAEDRADETNRACLILGVDNVRLGFRDDDDTVTPGQIFARAVNVLPRAIQPSDTIYVPLEESGGHPQHNLVARAFGRKTRSYLTYTTEGKSTSCNEVPFEPEWVALKLRALAEFKSQFQPAAGCVEHFLRGLREYML